MANILSQAKQIEIQLMQKQEQLSSRDGQNTLYFHRLQEEVRNSYGNRNLPNLTVPTDLLVHSVSSTSYYNWIIILSFLRQRIVLKVWLFGVTFFHTSVISRSSFSWTPWCCICTPRYSYECISIANMSLIESLTKWKLHLSYALNLSSEMKF